MPTSSSDILSDDMLQNAIRVDEDNADLRSSADAAIQYCIAFSGRPLLDVSEEMEVGRPTPADCPLILPVTDVMQIDGIKYWTRSQALREEPTGTVHLTEDPTAQDRTAGDAIGRVKQRAGKTEIWPPKEGWPDILPDSMFEVSYTRGFEGTTEDPAAGIPNLKQVQKAALLATRLFFEGDSDPRPWQTVQDILIPGFANAEGLQI